VSNGERHFGVAGAGASNGERHFGGGPAGPDGRNFHDASVGPRRSSSGRQFSYHGHAYGRFAGARYHWPRGYGYHRYAIGYRLPRAYWVSDYFLADYVDYGLDPPPDDFQWIRYGPDILLINQDTGEIAQVIYGAFDDSGDVVAQDDGDQGAPGN
jgi:Ni/Co efflux regulator RcnB